MTTVNSISAYSNVPANYNAVKIRIDEPVTNVPEGFKPSADDHGIYNAVDLEINRPSVNVYKDSSSYTGLYPVNFYDMFLPQPPVTSMAYVSSINAEIINEDDNVADAEVVEENVVEENVEEPVDAVSVPEPNVTSADTEETESAAEIIFHGLNFKGNNKTSDVKSVEIVPSVDIKPDVDINAVCAKLSDKNFDIQAQQMEEIARIAIEEPKKAIPYVTTEVFNNLIDVIKYDSTKLEPPTQAQIDTRKMIIINQLVQEQSIQNGEDPEKVELPYKLSKEDMISAINLSPMEQAERNKEYALYTIAILNKVFIDEVFEQTGNVVPLTDLPGISNVVDSLRHSDNSAVKIASIDALQYIKRPEYNEELKSILSIVAKDSDEIVSKMALMALMSINEQK